MEIDLPYDRLVTRVVPPILYSQRLPPVQIPSLRPWRIAVVDLSGQPQHDIQVEAAGVTLEFGYRLAPTACTTDTGGTCALALTNQETANLRVQGLTRMETRSGEDLIVITAAQGVGPPYSEAPDALEDEPRFDVSISVSDDRGEPLSGVSIWRQDEPRCFGKTNADGIVILDTQREDDGTSYVVGVPGYEIRTFRMVDGKEEYHIALSPADGILYAEIVDPERSPIEDVVIEWLDAGRLAFTDENGRFSILGLQSNQWADLDLRRNGFSPQERRALVLREGEAGDTRWKMFRTSTAKGRVVDEQGEPAIDLEPGLGLDETIDATFDAEGRFRVQGVPRGPQILVFRQAGDIVASVDFVAPDSGAEIDVGVVRIRPTAKLWGWVVDESGRAVENADILVDLDPARLVQPPTLADGSAYYPALARTGSGGDFAIEGIAIGSEIAISAWKKGYATQQDVMLVKDAEETLTLHVRRLVPLGLRLVSARDGKPVFYATVFLNPGVPPEEDSDRLQLDHQRVLHSDYSGTLSAEVYPGGRGGYQVVADGYVGLSRQVRFPDEAGDELLIELQPAARLAGIVRGADGRPLPGVRVQAKEASGLMSPTDVTDPRGEFLMEGLPVGSVNLTLRAEGFGAQHREVEVFQERLNRVELVLEEPLRFDVSGRVETEDGEAHHRLQIQAIDLIAGHIYSTVTEVGGDFRFEGLPASRYRFAAMTDPLVIVADELQLREDVSGLRLVARRKVPDESRQ